MTLAAAAKVRSLDDVQLAVVLSLVVGQHCIIATPEPALGSTVQSLTAFAARDLGLSCAVVACSAETTVADFRAAVLTKQQARPQLDDRGHDDDHEGGRRLSRLDVHTNTFLDERRVADVVLVTGLSLTSQQVQSQALEVSLPPRTPSCDCCFHGRTHTLQLLRTRRILSNTALHSVSRNFLFVSLQSVDSEPALDHHLVYTVSLPSLHGVCSLVSE